MAQAKEIKQRIKSIKSTQKTTKAMELVAGAKMRKAVVGAVSTRSYSTLAWGIMNRLKINIEKAEYASMKPFFLPAVPEENQRLRTTIVVFTSNRGLCGGFNSNVVKTVDRYMKSHRDEEVKLVCIGKKGAATLHAYGYAPAEVYEKKDSAQTDDSVRAIAAELYSAFSKKQTDKVLIAYTDYKSALAQEAVIAPLYPLPSNDSISTRVENLAPEEQKKRHMEKEADLSTALEYIYEPHGFTVLSYLIPRIAEVQLYQALLESNASEHSSRMIAMKSASDAAKEMGQELLLQFNRARQAGITKEIAEITAGSAAVS